MGFLDDALLKPLFTEEPFVTFDLKALLAVYRIVVSLYKFFIAVHSNFSGAQFLIV